MMDIGFTGLYMLLIYGLHALFVVIGIKNKWKDRLSILKANLMQSNVLDQLPVVITSLIRCSKDPLHDFDRKLSFISSLLFISIFVYEYSRQYTETKRLSSI